MKGGEKKGQWAMVGAVAVAMDRGWEVGEREERRNKTLF